MFKAIVDNLDGIDEKYHDLYVEKDGKFHFIQVEGLKPLSEFTTVHTALSKERNDHKDTKQKLAGFAGLNPDEVRAQLDRIPELEIAATGKVDEKAIEAIVSTRIASKLAPIERDRDRLVREAMEKDNTIKSFVQGEKTRKITDAVRSAARTAKVLDTAQEDAILLAERVFEVTDEGSVVTRDGVGVTPGISPDIWLTDLRTSRSHWWGPSAGGGATGGRSGTGSGPNPFSADGWNMTAQGALIKADRVKAEQMAKAAGTTIGGAKPAAKK